MWDGSINAAISNDENGNTVRNLVWTGTKFNGKGFLELGFELGVNSVAIGRSLGREEDWIFFGSAQLGRFPLFAISELLEVPVGVPEPEPSPEPEPEPSGPVPIILNGQTFQVSLLETSVANDRILLQSQPWFTGTTDVSFARSAVSQVGDSLGFPNPSGSDNSGPIFVSSIGIANQAKGQSIIDRIDPETGTFLPASIGKAENKTVVYAVANPIPESTNILGLLTLAAIGLLTHKKC